MDHREPPGDGRFAALGLPVFLPELVCRFARPCVRNPERAGFRQVYEKEVYGPGAADWRLKH